MRGKHEFGVSFRFAFANARRVDIQFVSFTDVSALQIVLIQRRCLVVHLMRSSLVMLQSSVCFAFFLLHLLSISIVDQTRRILRWLTDCAFLATHSFIFFRRVAVSVSSSPLHGIGRVRLLLTFLVAVVEHAHNLEDLVSLKVVHFFQRLYVLRDV